MPVGLQQRTVRGVPDIETVVTGVGIVLIAVVVWTAVSLLRGSMVDLFETVMFALVFAFLYFTGLYYLGGGASDAEKAE